MNTTLTSRPLTDKQTSCILEHIDAQIKLHNATIGHNRLFNTARIVSCDESKWKFPKRERGLRVHPEMRVPMKSFDRVVEMLRGHGFIVNTSDYTNHRMATVSKSNPA